LCRLGFRPGNGYHPVSLRISGEPCLVAVRLGEGASSVCLGIGRLPDLSVQAQRRNIGLPPREHHLLIRYLLVRARLRERSHLRCLGLCLLGFREVPRTLDLQVTLVPGPELSYLPLTLEGFQIVVCPGNARLLLYGGGVRGSQVADI